MSARNISYGRACALIEARLKETSRTYAEEIGFLYGNSTILETGILPCASKMARIKMLRHIEVKSESDACAALISPPEKSIYLLRAIEAEAYTPRIEALITKCVDSSNVVDSKLSLEEKLEWYIAAQQGAIHISHQAVRERGELESEILEHRLWMAMMMMPGVEFKLPRWNKSTPAAGINIINGEPVVRFIVQAPFISIEAAMEEVDVAPDDILKDLLNQFGPLPPVFSGGLSSIHDILTKFVAPGARMEFLERLVTNPPSDPFAIEKAIMETTLELMKSMPAIVDYETRHLEPNPDFKAAKHAHRQHIANLTGGEWADWLWGKVNSATEFVYDKVSTAESATGTDTNPIVEDSLPSNNSWSYSSQTTPSDNNIPLGLSMSTTVYVFVALLFFVSLLQFGSRTAIYKSIVIEHIARLTLLFHHITDDTKFIDTTVQLNLVISGLVLLHEIALATECNDKKPRFSLVIPTGFVALGVTMFMFPEYVHGVSSVHLEHSFVSDLSDKMESSIAKFTALTIMAALNTSTVRTKQILDSSHKMRDLKAAAVDAMCSIGKVFMPTQYHITAQGATPPSVVEFLSVMVTCDGIKSHITAVSIMLYKVITASIQVCVPLFILNSCSYPHIQTVYTGVCAATIIVSLVTKIAAVGHLVEPKRTLLSILSVPLSIMTQPRVFSTHTSVVKMYNQLQTFNIGTAIMSSLVHLLPLYSTRDASFIDVFANPKNLLNILADATPKLYNDILDELSATTTRKRTNSLGLTIDGTVVTDVTDQTALLQSSLRVTLDVSVFSFPWNVQVNYASYPRGNIHPVNIDEIFFSFDKLMWHRAMLLLLDVNSKAIDKSLSLRMRNNVQTAIKMPFRTDPYLVLLPPQMDQVESKYSVFDGLFLSYTRLQNYLDVEITHFPFYEKERHERHMRILLNRLYPTNLEVYDVAKKVISVSTMCVLPVFDDKPSELKYLAPLILGFPMACIAILDPLYDPTVLETFLKSKWDKGNILIEYYLDANMIAHLRNRMNDAHQKVLDNTIQQVIPSENISRLAPLLLRYAHMLDSYIRSLVEIDQRVPITLWNQLFGLVGVFLTASVATFKTQTQTNVMQDAHAGLIAILQSLLAYDGKAFPLVKGFFEDPNPKYKNILDTFNSWLQKQNTRDSSDYQIPKPKKTKNEDLSRTGGWNDESFLLRSGDPPMDLQPIPVHNPPAKGARVNSLDMPYMRNIGEKSRLLPNVKAAHITMFWVDANDPDPFKNKMGKPSGPFAENESHRKQLVSLFIRPTRDELYPSERTLILSTVKGILAM